MKMVQKYHDTLHAYTLRLRYNMKITNQKRTGTYDIVEGSAFRCQSIYRRLVPKTCSYCNAGDFQVVMRMNLIFTPFPRFYIISVI